MSKVLLSWGGLKMKTDEEYARSVEDRLISNVTGFYSLYSEDNVITETEIRVLGELGYKFNSVGLVDGKVRALFVRDDE